MWNETVYREEMTQIIDKHMENQAHKWLGGLIVFNSHKHIYSMEKFFTTLADSYGLRIWADDESKLLIDCLQIEDGQIGKMLVSRPEDARVHILSDDKFDSNVSIE